MGAAVNRRQAGPAGCGIILLITGLAASAAEPTADCGTKALYFLLRLEGRPAEPERILATLDEVAGAATGKSPISGRSMKELRDAAGRLGVPLDGVRWPRGAVRPDRPVIAFLDRRPHGHFIAVRPVGHTSKLVQVLDGEAEPEVVDAARLTAAREWTGLILEPRRANRASRLLVVGIILLVLLAPTVWRRLSCRPAARAA